MSRFLIFFSIVFFSYSLYAEIVLDGSLGTSKALSNLAKLLLPEPLDPIIATFLSVSSKFILSRTMFSGLFEKLWDTLFIFIIF